MKMQRLALEEDGVYHSWMSKSNGHFQQLGILKLHVYRFNFKKGIFVLSWLDKKPEKNL